MTNRKTKMSTAVSIIAVTMAVGMAMLIANSAYAADTINTSEYFDTNNDGQVDSARLTFDENVTACTYEAGDWSVLNASNFNVTITGISCTGADAHLDVALSADVNETGSPSDPIIAYTNQGTAGSVTLTSGAAGTHSPIVLGDKAGPILITADISYGSVGSSYNSNAIKFTYSEAIKVYGDGAGGSEILPNDIQGSHVNFGGMTVSKTLSGIGSWNGVSDMTQNNGYGNSLYHTMAGDGLEVYINGHGASYHYNSGSTAPSAGDILTPYSNTNFITDTVGNAVNAAHTVPLTQSTAWDVTVPTIVARTSCDPDEDGDIDVIILQIDDAIIDASVTVADFTVDDDNTINGFGEEVASAYSTDTINCNGLGAIAGTNDSAIQIELTTGITGTESAYIHYTSTGLRDDAGNLLATFTGATTVDRASPQDLTALNVTAKTDTSVSLSWTALTSEPLNFAGYNIWYGESKADVEARGGTATLWNFTDDAALGTVTTNSTTINVGLDMTKTNYFQISATDATAVDNETSLPTINATNAATGGSYTCSTLGTVEVTAPTTVTQNNVTLSFSYPTDVTQIVISEDQDFTLDHWQTIDESIAFELSEGAGEKTIYFLFKNSCGSTSTQAVTVTLQEEATSDTPTDDSSSDQPADDQADETTDDTQDEIVDADDVEANKLVRTQDSSAVYFLDTDGFRHVFASSTIFFSWYTDFTDVQVVSTDLIATYKIGSRVRMAPGSLIKIQSDAKVYAIDENGSKHHIDSEATAIRLFGEDWATKVVDIDPTQYTDYPDGEVIDASVLEFNPTVPAYPYI